MTSFEAGHRLSTATGLDKGDRDYQQDQVQLIAHPRVPGCVLGIVADGMGGKSGGRKASDQVVLTARQLFERFAPQREQPEAVLRQMVLEAHLMIKLTAITSEEEPHSTLAAFLMMPDLSGHVVHAGDSRVYHYRGRRLKFRTSDHSYVQRLVDEGKLTPQAAETHPQSNLLTGCLGATRDPPVALHPLGQLEVGDTVMACSDGLWHYFSEQEMGLALDSQSPGEASQALIAKARERARGGGDNLSLVLVRVEPR